MSEETSFRNLDDYIRQWKKNRRCCQSLERQFIDWQVTIIFYTALHAVNAAAAHLGERLCDHKSRNDLVKFNQAFAGIRQNYLLLYRLSRFTRYDPDPEAWLPQQFLNAQAVVDQVLSPIENQIQTLIGKDLKLLPLQINT